MPRFILSLIAILFVSGCGGSADPAKPDATASNTENKPVEPEKVRKPSNPAVSKWGNLDLKEESPKAAPAAMPNPAANPYKSATTSPSNPASKSPAANGALLGIWRNPKPHDNFLSQAVTLKPDERFTITILTKKGGVHEIYGFYEIGANLLLEFDPRNQKFKNDEKITGQLVDAETLVINFPGEPQASYTRATTDTYEYPGTAAEKAKFHGEWLSKKPRPDDKSSSQSINADGTANNHVVHLYNDLVYDLGGTWKMISKDQILITRSQPGRRTEHFKCIGKLLDDGTLEIRVAGEPSIHVRK